MEKTLKRQIVDAAEAVKRKVRKIRDIEIDNKQALETVFKPLSEPLNLIVNSNKKAYDTDNVEYDETHLHPVDHNMKDESIGNNDVDDDVAESDSNTSFQSLNETIMDKDISSWSLSSEALDDVPFGVRFDQKKLMLGSAPIKISDEYIVVGEQKYRNTPGLKELLLKKSVDLQLVTTNDLKNYKVMLLHTNAHRRDFDPTKPIKSNKGQKYLQVIKPLFDQLCISPYNIKKGKALPLRKTWKKDVDLVYWDDPNELVDRLKLLIASRDAGNTGLDNEIISIIEELRESNIIK